MCSVLIDGFVGAIWKARRENTSARLHVSLFERQSDDLLEAIEAEGLALLRFVEDDADNFDVEFGIHA